MGGDQEKEEIFFFFSTLPWLHTALSDVKRSMLMPYFNRYPSSNFSGTMEWNLKVNFNLKHITYSNTKIVAIF